MQADDILNMDWLSKLAAEKQAAKRQKYGETKLERDRNYDKTDRQRSWQKAWTLGRPWLIYSDREGYMYCQICRQNKHGHAAASSFTKGTKSFQITSIKSHEESAGHQREKSALDAEYVPIEERPAQIMLKEMNRRLFTKLTYKFRIVHAISKHARPYTDYVWHCNLDTKKGLDIGVDYRNDKAAHEFAHHIAEVERHTVKSRVSKAGFASLIVDGSTDSSVKEQDILFIQTCTKGEINVDFLSIQQTRKADADGILESIKQGAQETLELESWNQFSPKLVGMATDGAAVMTGTRNGVVSKLQQSSCPTLVGVHCFAHRLELAYRNVMKQYPDYQQLDQFLLDIFLFYHNSNLNRANLAQACIAAGVKELVPTRVGGTRWLPHTLRALNNLWRIYPALILHLSQVKQDGQSNDAKGKATGFHEKLTTKRFVVFSHFIWDIVIQLAKLSCVLQRRLSSVSDVEQHLNARMTAISGFKDQPGPKLQKVKDEMELDGVSLGEGSRRQKSQSSMSNFEKTMRDICGDLVESLASRFDMADTLTEATSLGNIATWPADNLEELIAFGISKIDVLKAHFKPNLEHAGVAVDDINVEWRMLASLLFKRCGNSMQSRTWKSINRQFHDIAGNFLCLVDLIHSIPSTSVEAERGFSLMKRVKSDFRSSLDNSSLNDLLRIILLSKGEDEFDPSPAIESWWRATQRRPGQTGADQSVSKGNFTPCLAAGEDMDDSEKINLEELLSEV